MHGFTQILKIRSACHTWVLEIIQRRLVSDMSVIIKEGREKLLKILLEGKNTRHPFQQNLNSRDFCIICGQGRSVDNSTGVPYELIKHHMSYFPEKIAHVHYSCHKQIHNNPNSPFIQYSPGDSRRFYGLKKPAMLKQKNYERILE